MSDYRWYKYTFLSKVTLREDGFAGCWKERFLAGLHKLFAEKVKLNLEQHYGKHIQYDILTYGQIHNIVVDTEIQVCTDFKLQNKLRKESMVNKKELGTFCHQYGREPIKAPSAKKKKIIKKQNKVEKKTYKKPYNKKYNKAPQDSIKPKYKKLKKKDNVCWKCGRLGHYANSCKVAKKINQNRR